MFKSGVESANDVVWSSLWLIEQIMSSGQVWG
jgi:hypothetical protein